jgi:uncharacterized SAM-binding protein YcdF (DUF218 family)
MLRRLIRILFALSVLLLVAGSLKPVADSLCEAVESRYPPKPPGKMPSADAILVLGGGIDGAMPPRIIPQLQGGGSRAWYAVKLWKAGKAPLIIGVGGSHSTIPESAAIAEFLIDMGVRPEAILQESASRTTVENALLVKRLLSERGIKRSLLVTSSMHMPRAYRIFQAAGIDVIPASADAETVRDRRYAVRDWLPNAEALFRTQRVIKEIVGFYAYPVQFRLAGEPITLAQPHPLQTPRAIDSRLGASRRAGSA